MNKYNLLQKLDNGMVATLTDEELGYLTKLVEEEIAKDKVIKIRVVSKSDNEN